MIWFALLIGYLALQDLTDGPIIVSPASAGKILVKTSDNPLMRLIHITDPHLSSLQDLSFLRLRGKRRSGYLSWYKNRRHIHRREILDRLVRAVSAESPDQILICGDLVHIGLEQEIIEAKQWLQSLGSPEKLTLIPGNHDNYAPDSLAAMKLHWSDYLPDRNPGSPEYCNGYPVRRENDEFTLCGLNSSCVTPIFSAAGKLGLKQRDRLVQALHRDPADNRFQCLLIHHPPLPGMTRWRKALRDAAQLQQIIEQQAPDLVLYGHIHCNREHVLGNTRIYCTASASSVHDASYRVFDLQAQEQGWTCEMRLMTLDNGLDSSESFKLANSSCWTSTPGQA